MWSVRELRIREIEANHFNVWNEAGDVCAGLTFEELLGLMSSEFMPKGGVPYRAFINPDKVTHGLLMGDTGHD